MAELCDDTQCIAAVGQRRNTGDHLAGVVLGKAASHFGRCAVASNEEDTYDSVIAGYFDVIARNHNIFACRDRAVEQAGQSIGDKPDTGHVGFCTHVDHFYVFQGITELFSRNDVECQFVDSRIELSIRVLESTQDTRGELAKVRCHTIAVQQGFENDITVLRRYRKDSRQLQFGAGALDFSGRIFFGQGFRTGFHFGNAVFRIVFCQWVITQIKFPVILFVVIFHDVSCLIVNTNAVLFVPARGRTFNFCHAG